MIICCAFVHVFVYVYKLYVYKLYVYMLVLYYKHNTQQVFFIFYLNGHPGQLTPSADHRAVSGMRAVN
jgi:hypothetical protein